MSTARKRVDNLNFVALFHPVLASHGGAYEVIAVNADDILADVARVIEEMDHQAGNPCSQIVKNVVQSDALRLKASLAANKLSQNTGQDDDDFRLLLHTA